LVHIKKGGVKKIRVNRRNSSDTNLNSYRYGDIVEYVDGIYKVISDVSSKYIEAIQLTGDESGINWLISKDRILRKLTSTSEIISKLI